MSEGLISKSQVEKTVREYAAQLGVRQLTAVNSQPPDYIFQADTTYVIRAIISENPSAEFAKVTKRIAILRSLQKQGADVMEFSFEPVAKDGVVIVVSPFYPSAMPIGPDGYRRFGRALAALHNAGLQAPEAIDALETINPLVKIWELFNYLRTCEQEGKPFAIQNVSFPGDVLEIFQNQLTKAQAAYDEMMRLAVQKKRLTALMLDVYPDNIRFDSSGQPKLIDLLGNIAKGPPEYDLARPSAHWVRRIGRDPQLLEAFMTGYKKEFSGYGIDDTILQHAVKVANIYYASSMLKNAVNAHRLGQLLSKEWQLTETVSRIRHLEDPFYRWKAARDYE